MGKGLVRSLSRGEPERQAITKYRVAFDEEIAIDGTAVGFGTLPLGLLPEGDILFLGASIDIWFDGSDSAELDATWEGDFGIGTVATDNAFLGATEVNIIGSNSIPAATAKVAQDGAHHATNDCGTVFDNTGNTLGVHLNILIDNADISGDTTLRVHGFFTIVLAVLGDD